MKGREGLKIQLEEPNRGDFRGRWDREERERAILEGDSCSGGSILDGVRA